MYSGDNLKLAYPLRETNGEWSYPEFTAYLAEQGAILPRYVQREFEAYLKCGLGLRKQSLDRRFDPGRFKLK